MFDYPCFPRQDTGNEIGQSLINTNGRVGKDVELDIGEIEDQSGTSSRTKSSRNRVKTRRYMEEEVHTSQEAKSKDEEEKTVPCETEGQGLT